MPSLGLTSGSGDSTGVCQRSGTASANQYAPASEDVSVSFFFPTHDGHGSKLPINDVVTVLCHFSNEGETAMNISAAMGSLNVAQDFGIYVQNFSFKPYGMVVPPNEEVTLAYEFMMDPRRYHTRLLHGS